LILALISTVTPQACVRTGMSRTGRLRFHSIDVVIV
jgi:hypothetical protein